MNEEDIIRMADKAGLADTANAPWLMKFLERFAKLVAEAEREACAKVAEGTDCCKWPTPVDCAFAIRARGRE
jgi:hypothetical protein